MAAESDPLEPPPAISDDDLDRLYTLPLAEFVDARDALAKELRRDKKREEAAWVKGLKKPSVAAWLTNQLIRQKRARAKAFFSAAETLRQVQGRLAEGKSDAAALRQAREGERATIDALVEAATDVGDDEALSEATLERVRETLNAVPLDEETRRRVEVARLAREQTASGFGLFGAVPSAPASTTHKRERGTKDEDRERRQRHEAAKGELRRLQESVRAARRATGAARKTAEMTQKERNRLEKRLQRERAEVAASEERVARLEREVRKTKRRVEVLAK